jgi:hypothetical protein
VSLHYCVIQRSKVRSRTEESNDRYLSSKRGGRKSCPPIALREQLLGGRSKIAALGADSDVLDLEFYVLVVSSHDDRIAARSLC